MSPQQELCHFARPALSKLGYSHNAVGSLVASKGGGTVKFPSSQPWLSRAWLEQLPPADVLLWMKGKGLGYLVMYLLITRGNPL